MCCCPITIPNRVVSFDPHYDRLYNTVPCGHCVECEKQKQSAWYARSYYEWLGCKSKGGYALFVTFTYNNDWIPTLQIDGKIVYCFDKVDMQMFLDALRKSIKRKYKRDMPFRYIITSEYGGKTYRPHYHGILYIQYGISPYFIRQEIKRLWKYGFIKYGENLGVISDYRGLRYVLKYITKDKAFAPIEKKIKELPHDCYLYYHNRTCPFHIQSHGLGLCAKNFVNKELLDSGLIPIPTKDGFVNIKIPLYLDRKYYYEYNKLYKGYYPTAEGVRVSLARNVSSETYLKKHYDDIFLNVSNLCTPDALSLIHEQLWIDVDTDYILKLCQKVQEKYDDFLYYIKNERFYMYVTDGFPEQYKSNQKASLFEILFRKYQIGQSKEYNEFYSSESTFARQSEDIKIRKKAMELTYNNISSNQNFELCAQILEVLQRAEGIRKNAEAQKKRLQDDKLQKYKHIYKYEYF